MKNGRWRTVTLTVVFGVLAAIWLVVPQSAMAHAALVEAEPASGSVLDASPAEIRLTFNERLESGLYYIRVYDGMGREVTKEEARLSQDQRDVQVALPTLRNGSYTVSYRVISADGHPVSASYVFHVGEVSMLPGDGSGSGAGHHHHHVDGIDGRAILLHGSKALYLITLLLFAGLALWSLRRGFAVSGTTSEVRDAAEADNGQPRLQLWLLTVLRLFVLALIASIGVQLSQLMDGWSPAEWRSLLDTSLGRLWAIHLVGALVGLIVLGVKGREETGMAAWQRYVLAVLAVLLLGTKATSGHAAATEPVWVSIAFDFVHLLMAAVWSGGLLIVLLLWRKSREQLRAFLPVFSRFAWISIVVLAISGFLLTLLMLPGPAYLLYSSWGIALLVKVGAVLLIIPVAGMIRRQMKRRGVPAGKLVATDFSLALVIVVLAAVLSGLNPVPTNKPLHWHVMGADIHMTAQIAPNEPGMNRFAVKVWLPEEDGEPEQVALQLIPLLGEEDPAPIDIPLVPSEDLGEMDFFPDFERYDYAGEGVYLAFPGKWQVRVMVTAPGGKPYVFTEEMRVY